MARCILEVAVVVAVVLLSVGTSVVQLEEYAPADVETMARCVMEVAAVAVV